MKTRYFLIVIFCVLAIPAFSQVSRQTLQSNPDTELRIPTGCGTEVTSQQINMELARDPQEYKQLKQSFINNLTPPKEFIIQLHLLSNDDGSNSSSVTLAQIRSEIANYVNPYFSTSILNATFVECGGAILHNSTAFNSLSGFSEGDAMAAAFNAPNVINIYIVDDASGYCGWAYFPSSLPKDYVVLAYGCVTNQSTFVHELGHYFDVYHTHQAGSLGTENVTRNPLDACYNAATTGDLLADTDADPVLSGKINSSCIASGLGTGPCGLPYTPDPTNIMSYSDKACRTIFSVGQQTRMAAAMATSRAYLTTGCSYCIAYGGSAIYEWIDAVSIGTFSNTSGSSGTSGYSDYTSLTINATAGESYPVSLIPGFSGTAYLEYWKIWIDYNGDGDFDDAGELALDPGSASSSTVTGSITIPSGVAGITRMRVSMKFGGTQDPCDFFPYGEVEDYTIDISAGLPDLIPINLVMGATTVSAGSTFSVDCKIKNLGIGASSANSVGFYLSTDAIFDGGDIRLDGASVGGQASGATSGVKSGSLTIPGGTTLGTYYILFAADEYDDEAESDEGNNVKSRSITVGSSGSLPDLIPINLVMGATTVSAGSTFSVDCKIKNLGTGASSANSVGFYLSSNTTFDGGDIRLDGASVGGQASGATSGVKSGSLTIPGGTTPGAYYILFAADEYDDEAESDEGNNVKSRSITVGSSGSLPDLIPINLVMGATTVSAGSTFSVDCKIKNLGTGASSANSVGFYLSSNTTFDGGDIRLDGASVGSQASGATSGVKSGSLTIPGGTTPGAYYILFAADEYDDEAESDEGNNVKSRLITVGSSGSLPDLIPINLVMGATTVSAGSTFSVDCKIKNLGTGASSANSVGFYLSSNTTFDGGDIRLDGASVGSQASGATSGVKSGSLTIPGGTTPGAYYIIFAADEYDDEAESDEGNNVKSRLITVGSSGSLPDLIPINLVMGATTVSAGSTFSVDCKIKNLGTGASSANSVGFYLSSNTTFDGGDIRLDGASVGGQVSGATSGVKNGSLTIPAITTNGTYYILFVADEFGTVSESNEINNIKDRQITVTGNPFTGTSRTEKSSDGLFDLKQYPNPSQGEFFVEFTSVVNTYDSVELNIYDASGRLVLKTKFNNVQKGSTYEIDVSPFSSGSYNLIYTTKDNVLTKKLILKN